LPNRDISQVASVSEVAASGRIAERRVIVYKTLVDESVVKLIAEKFKSKLFARLDLPEPEPREVLCVSVEKFYEPFLVVVAKYVIDYYRKRDVSFGVDEEVQEVVVGEQIFKPQSKGKEVLGEEVRLPILERIVKKRKVYMVFDRFGDEFDLERLPVASSEEKPESILEEFREKVETLEVPPDMELETIRCRIVEKAVDAEKIVWQSFEVSDRVVIYVPCFKVAFKNIKTGEVESVKIDGVTGTIAWQNSKVI